MPADDIAPEIIDRPGRVVLVCEHASNHFPDRFGALGLDSEARHSHAAWDPGARALTLALSDALDASVVAGTVSRLVYDCNRPPEADSAMLAVSEKFAVPGNANLTPEARAERVAAVYRPFSDAVIRTLDAHADPLLVTIHSFTPVYFGQRRETEIGILHDTDTRIADAMLARKSDLPHRRIDRNEPYGPQDGVTHTLRAHALPRGIPNVMIEVRNDLLATEADIATMATELLTLLTPALAAANAEASHA